MLIAHYSCLLKMSVVVDVHPPVAELLLEFVAVSQHHWNELCVLIIIIILLWQLVTYTVIILYRHNAVQHA